jgi:glycosyltransferase 2 family protein
MNQAGSRRILGRVLRWLIPFLISFFAIWWVLRDVDLSQLGHNFAQIGWRAFLLATLAFFVAYCFRVFCWYILLRKKVSFWDAFFTMGAGYLLNNVFPFRLGEIGRALLLDDQQGSSALEVLSSVIVERVFDVLLAAVFVLATLPKIVNGVYDETFILIALIVALLGLVVLYLAARFRDRIIAWLNGWGEKSKFIQLRVAPRMIKVLEGLSVLTHPPSFLLAFGSLAISWLIAFGENYIIFRSLYDVPPFWWMIFVLSVGAFGAALPSAPASLGIFEGVMVAAFALLGVDAELGFAHAIVIHAMSFIYANIFGLIGLRLRGQALIALYHRAVRRTPEVTQLE